MSTDQEQSQPDRRAAFEALVAEYEGPLLRYAARIVRDRDAAQDVVQDTFIKLFKSWEGDLKPSPNALNWLYRVAHNNAVDHLRRRDRRRAMHLRHASERQECVPPEVGGHSTLSPDAERAAEVLGLLSLREQQLVVLKVYEGKSYREIGEITGLSTGNVGYILHNAMKKMAEELKKAKSI